LSNIKISFLFYLLPFAVISGPFIADLYITILALISLYFIFFKKKNNYLKNNYFRIFILWCLILITSSFLSNHVLLSLESSLFYFRFGFFFIFVLILLDQNINNLKFFLIPLRIILIFLITDGYFQYFFGYNLIGFEKVYNSSRFAGIYRDELVLGSVIVRLLPIYLAIELHYNFKKINYYFLYIFILYLPLLFLIGERTAILLGVITLFFSLFVIKNKFSFKKIFVTLIFIITGISSFIYFDESSKKRLIVLTMQQFTDASLGNIIFPKIYGALYSTSFKMFVDKPILGHGPKSFREVCKESKYNIILNDSSGYDNCSTHPHSFYLQLLGETGILGTLPIIILFILVTHHILKTSFILFHNKTDRFLILRHFILLSIFLTLWPLAPSGNFFNNWFSSIYYFPIGIMIYINLKSKF
jgi:O-antigen ligase